MIHLVISNLLLHLIYRTEPHVSVLPSQREEDGDLEVKFPGKLEVDRDLHPFPLDAVITTTTTASAAADAVGAVENGKCRIVFTRSTDHYITRVFNFRVSGCDIVCAIHNSLLFWVLLPSNLIHWRQSSCFFPSPPLGTCQGSTIPPPPSLFSPFSHYLCCPLGAVKIATS